MVFRRMLYTSQSLVQQFEGQELRKSIGMSYPNLLTSVGFTLFAADPI